MPKQAININFSQGLDTKTDPFQIPIGKFARLQNSIFNKGGLLQKCNGFGALTALPDSSSTYATTFNGALTAIGTSLEAYSASSKTWTSKGSIQPLELSTLPLIRNNFNQTQADTAIAPNGLVCTAYSQTDGTTVTYKYAIADSSTGQNVIAPTAISGASATLGTPKVFLMGNYFIVVYSTASRLKFIAISTINPAMATAAADITTSYTPASTVAFDGAVLNGALYLAWNGGSASGVKMAFIGSNLSVSATINPDSSHVATLMSVCADTVNNVIWAFYYNLGTTTGYALAVDGQLSTVTAATQVIASGTILNVTSVASAGTMTAFYEVSNTASGIQTNFIDRVTLTQGAVLGTPAVMLRSVGLASKAFYVGSTIYVLAAYSSTYQPTYFLINASTSTSAAPVIISKLAYQNGGGYLTKGLPSVSVDDTTARVSYLFKDLVQSVNKDTNVLAGSQTAGVYSQTGVNLATFEIGTSNISTAEIGGNLNITGGFIWAYDGYTPVEQEFFLYPDSVQATATATTGGNLAAQIYYYQVTYEWSDNQGNIFRSAPSVPLIKDIAGAGTATSTITLVIPTLRLTYKTANPVKIVIYRWSTAQQSYYQVTSIASPTQNSTTADSVTYIDTLSDATILGNNLLYTTGGVLENIGPPAVSALTLFDDRLFAISSEDPNLIIYSKQVVEATPVEMSDLLTIYVAPTLSAQGSTGPLKCLAAMDDKLILFKKDAIYYINGTGPDNTGANSQYSQPVFITSSVGCENQQSIVLSPMGLLFQSDKGKWLLGRDLSTQYIGAPVEDFNANAISGALGIPGTNQDRFTSPSGTTLMHDYYYQQWGTFTNAPAVSSTLYEGLHTYISSLGQVFQETPGVYLNASNPVLMAFTTGWINLAGLQGYQRAYYFYLLGTYLSPHKLSIQIAYDYNPSAIQSLIIQPNNYSPTYGGATLYGSGLYGGPSSLEKWRIFFKQQKCQAFQLTVQEIYDPSYGVVAGPGLTLSGINCVVNVKKGYSPQAGAVSAG